MAPWLKGNLFYLLVILIKVAPHPTTNFCGSQLCMKLETAAFANIFEPIGKFLDYINISFGITNILYVGLGQLLVFTCT